MLEQNARVLEVRDNVVVVETISNAGCQDCSTRSGCGTGLLSELFKPKKAGFTLENTLRLSVGDQVVIAILESDLMWAAVQVYLLPLVAMFVCAMLAEYVVASSGQFATLLGGAGGFALAVAGLRFRYGHMAQPVLLRRITSFSIASRE